MASTAEPIADLTGTTWVLNNTLNLSLNSWGLTYISNNTTYDYIEILQDKPTRVFTLNYGIRDTGEMRAVYSGQNGWSDNAFKIISITGGTDATNTGLISWFEANATLQAEEPTVDYSDKYVNGENLKELIKKLRNEIAATGGKDVYKQDVNIEENTDDLGTYHRISVTTTYKDGTTKTSRAVILPSGGSYTLPAATADNLGGVKVGDGLSVASDGTLSVSGSLGGGAIVDAAALPTATETSPDLVRIQGKYLYVKTSYDAGTVIGFTGLTNSSGVLTLTDEAADIATYTKATNGEYISVSSDLDNVFPYNQLEEVTDDSGNVFIKFPKMYIKWITDTNGYIDGFKCANYQVDSDFFIPDCFLSPAADGSYLDHILIGKYEGSGSSSKVYSKTGATCLVSITRAGFRVGSRAYGTSADYYNGYQQLDLSMLTLYNFLCMMYYRTANIQTVYAGRTSASAAEATGSTDSISGLNGWNTTTGCVKMLGVENPYGNILKWVDGVYFSSETIYTHRYPTQFADSTTNGITMGFSRPTSSNYIIYLKKGMAAATKSNVYAATVGGTADTYVGDYCYYGSGSAVLYAGGYWSHGSSAGLWYLNGDYSASDAGTFVGGRLCCRPLN